MRTFIFAAAGLAAMTLSTAAFACSISDIEVKQASWVRRGSQAQFLSAVGEIYNGCADAIGVHLEAVFRNKAGQVVTMVSFWPASTRNIPAHTSQAFDHPADDDDHLVTSVDLRVIEVHSWRDR